MKDIVSNVVAKLAKGKGFNEKCDSYYFLNYPKPFKTWDKRKYDFIQIDKEQNILIPAPSYSQILRWLRDEKQCFLQLFLLEQLNPYGGWGYELTYFDKENEMNNTDENMDLETYELAVEVGLKHALTLI